MNYFHILKRKIPNLIKMEAMESTIPAPKVIKEGLAEIRLTSDNVFYNRVQEFNRDLSTAVLNVFIDDFKLEESNRIQKAQEKQLNGEGKDTSIEEEKQITILEALSATGLRSIRYAKEVAMVNKIIANDLSEKAVESIKANIVHNNVESLVETSHGEASALMYKHIHETKQFTAIDLDPYGCPSIFLDAAVQSVQGGGLLLVTATDMAVLAGNSADTCYAKYGAISLKANYCHEMALRILVQCIESHANRYGRFTEPLLCISVDFYIRVFVRVHNGKKYAKKCLSKLAMVHRCVGCDTSTLQPLGGFRTRPGDPRAQPYLPLGPPVREHCAHCNQRHQIGGPIWSAPIHDIQFVNQLIHYVEDNGDRFATSKRMKGILMMIREEVHHAPLYYAHSKMFGKVHLQGMPILTFRSAILNGGFEVSFAHSCKESIKTTAPPQFMWDVLRAWHKLNPASEAKLKVDPVANFIMSQPMKYEIDLTERPDANPESRREGQLRYQNNPPHWGPGSRAMINFGMNHIEKSLRNQNKSKRNRESKKRPHTPEESPSKILCPYDEEFYSDDSDPSG